VDTLPQVLINIRLFFWCIRMHSPDLYAQEDEWGDEDDDDDMLSCE
jgi:hypothetical protein